MKKEISHINAKIFGKVQGVGFRHFSKMRAEGLGVRGFVRNEPDGTVYLEAEGTKEVLDEFLKWCKEGLESMDVKLIDASPGEVKGFSDFHIK